MVNPVGVTPELLELIVCPACHGGLVSVDAVSLRCTGCARVYPIVDGIPVLLIERARDSRIGKLEEEKIAPVDPR